MMEFVIEHAWQFWALIIGLLLAAGIWGFVSYVLIERHMTKRKESLKNAAVNRK
jgi:hypothetical protein